MRTRRPTLLVSLFLTCACDTCATAQPATPKEAPIERPEVIHSFPHDTGAFTQGLVFTDGILIESTGQYGSSQLRKVELGTGRVFAKIDLANDLFGEGLARLGNELFQLTWREHRCLVYDLATLEKRREIKYEGEGWGLTTDGTSLIMSDGSSSITFRDPKTFRVVNTIRVEENNKPVGRLNELEWVNGEILANVWGSDRIVRIDPRSGAVKGELDLSALPEPHKERSGDDVLNGIAFDASTNRLFVTGKRWSTLFEIAWPK